MRAPTRLLLVIAVIAPGVLAAFAKGGNTDGARSPIYGVAVPEDYRRWELVAPALEAAPLDEIRAVVGNATALGAYRKASIPFPDGTVLVKLAWKQQPSAEFQSATVPGTATTVQVMVKDARKYASTGGWGFGRFVDGVPANEAEHQTCFACHQALVKDRDYVFTRYAP